MDKFSFLGGMHSNMIDEMYEKFTKDPKSIDEQWSHFFQGYDFAKEAYSEDDIPQHFQKEFKVINLIDAYRKSGHLFTKTNPVRERRKYTPTLHFKNFGLDESDLEITFQAGTQVGIGPATLNVIIAHLEKVYCQSIGIEYMYIRDPEEIEWIKNRLHQNSNTPNFEVQQKKHIFHKLNQAVAFENFLHKKFVGQKRFSLEGAESLIPALDALIEHGSELGIKEFVMGMAHRGRLNVLANIFNKTYKEIFSEFEGKFYADDLISGDVKYHLGFTSLQKCNNGNDVKLNLTPNPSHLEAVNPVVEGITRAKLDAQYNGDRKKILPVLLHGDAALAGQGVVYEVIQMAQLDGYKTGGTIHIAVNNQVGFTTNYLDARSSTYCTDVAKVTLSPVIHVNGDDVEAVVHALQLAVEYRQKYHKDVFIDLLCYRKYGHNEGDEPRFTQPKLYKLISKHPNPKNIYASSLIKDSLISEEEIKNIELEYRSKLENQLEDSKKSEKTRITNFMSDEWSDYESVNNLQMNWGEVMVKPVDTTYPRLKLDKIAEVISNLPSDKKFINKIKKLVNNRQVMYDNNKLDWSMAEHLAYGSLLEEGYNVRISGQDVERGTFSHRHAIIKVEESEEEISLLNNINDNQGKFSIYNSLLSEYGVLGFEYGYAMADPKSLTIWEAQFGDFSNGAQIIIDQYLFSGEAKWKTQNGLVLFLPHGYEGQGAEHSSARMERYLQLCAKDNVFVANCTTPANMFHILRRQLKANYRKPLIIFTPKSLLRHPMVHSSVDDFVKGEFNLLIDDNSVSVEDVKSVVFVSGKFYYDILEERERQGRNDVAIVRLEQLFPLPKEHIKSIIKKYKNADDIVWAQEEPINMGAYAHLLINLKEARNFRVAARRFYSATAAGSSARYLKRHKEVIDFIFDKNKNNQIPE